MAAVLSRWYDRLSVLLKPERMQVRLSKTTDMRIQLLSTMMFSLALNAQFTGGSELDRDEATGYHYVFASGGQIWRDSGQGYEYLATASANAGQMLIAKGKLYVVRIDDVKVYELDPFGLDTVWNTPANEWLFGPAWDGASTLYCNDTEELFEVDMNTGTVTTILSGYQGSTRGKMAYDHLAHRLLFLEHNVGIWSYDLTSGTYAFLHPLAYHRLHDIIHACGDQWLVAVEFSQGAGMLYTVPEDFSASGDTTYSTLTMRPKSLYYHAVGDSPLFLESNAIYAVQQPCANTTGIADGPSEIEADIRLQQDHLIVTWPSNDGGSAALRLIDPAGRVVRSEVLNNAVLRQGHVVPIGAMANGSYALVLQHGTQRTTKKFAVVR